MQHAHLNRANQLKEKSPDIRKNALRWLDISSKNKSRQLATLSTLQRDHYGAQLGFYTIIGRWYAFRGLCGRGVANGDGDVSCRTTSACLRWSRRVYAGESSCCASPAVTMMLEEEMTPLSSSSAEGARLVGGVTNSSSPETSPIGPITSGHLQSHFHTIA